MLTAYGYDVMGNVTSVTNAQKNVTKYTYDLEGNMTSLTSPMGRTEQFAYDAGGRRISRLTAKGDTIRYDYDKLNRLVEKTYENASAGGETGGDAQNEHPVQMVYNQMGQRIAMEDITGGSSFTYDALGRLKTATNGSGKTVEYVYDEADNLKAILYPDGYEVQYEYDKNDNITTIIDRDHRETVYEYDEINRLVGVTRADGTTSRYTYNARDQIVEAENLCSCGFLISNYKYTYNDAGLITRELAKECLFVSNKDYGHKGGEKEECAHTSTNPWQNQNPQWQTTDRTFTYDGNGELLTCKESKGQFDKTTYTYTYDEVGNRTKATRQELFAGRPDITTYKYNADNQMTEADVCEGNLYTHYTFQYDANGNLTAECVKNCAEVRYQYDTENRLKAVYDKQKLLMAASYDGDGNRVFQLNYNPEAECGYGRNLSGEVFIPEHNEDEEGNLTAEGELFGYICSATGRAYDLTEYVNDTNRAYTQVLTAYTVNSGDTESYSYNGNQRLSRNNIWNEARGVDHNETSYYLYDGKGSVTANTWYNGMVTSVYQYDPYGQVTYGSTEHTDFYGYNAESYNPNTGLEYLRARYYNAESGRFFQEDTYLGDLREPLTLNRYAYVLNSPLNYVDPTGHDRDPSDFNRPHKKKEYNDWDREIRKEAGKRREKAISDFLDDNAGAIMGGTTAFATTAVVLLTAPGSLPVLFVGGMSMSMGGIGMALGGIGQAELTKASILKIFKEKGIDISPDDIILHNMDQMPEELQVKCEEYSEADQYEYQILEDGTIVTMAGTVLMDVSYLWEVEGASILKSGKKIGENLKNWINSWNKGGSGALDNVDDVRYRVGESVPPIEKTLDHYLNPEGYAYEVAEKYGINLKGSGQKITIKYNPELASAGKSRKLTPTVIEVGPQVFVSEAELANTITHELNHARDWLKGGNAPDWPTQTHPGAYSAGDSLAEYVRGER